MNVWFSPTKQFIVILAVVGSSCLEPPTFIDSDSGTDTSRDSESPIDIGHTDAEPIDWPPLLNAVVHERDLITQLTVGVTNTAEPTDVFFGSREIGTDVPVNPAAWMVTFWDDGSEIVGERSAGGGIIELSTWRATFNPDLVSVERTSTQFASNAMTIPFPVDDRSFVLFTNSDSATNNFALGAAFVRLDRTGFFRPLTGHTERLFAQRITARDYQDSATFTVEHIDDQMAAEDMTKFVASGEIDETRTSVFYSLTFQTSAPPDQMFVSCGIENQAVQCNRNTAGVAADLRIQLVRWNPNVVVTRHASIAFDVLDSEIDLPLFSEGELIYFAQQGPFQLGECDDGSNNARAHCAISINGLDRKFQRESDIVSAKVWYQTMRNIDEE